MKKENEFNWHKFESLSKHSEILEEQGFPEEVSLNKVYFSKTYCTPFKRKIKGEDLPRYKELVHFQRTNGYFTIRQFYYHLIQSQDPSIRLEAGTKKESDSAYKKTERIVNRCRLAGIIPFESVIDETDLLGTEQQFCTIEEFAKKKVEGFRSNWFENQECYVEVWLEKRALEEIIYPITDYYGVYLSCSGKNPTWSQVYSAIERFKAFNKPINYILYLGDLDPQGKDMVRWLQEEAFKVLEFDKVKIEPLAINVEHANNIKLNLYRIPSLKGRASVIDWYRKTYKIDYSIELDALDPSTLRGIVEKGISDRLDVHEIDIRRKKDQNNIQKIKELLSK